MTENRFSTPAAVLRALLFGAGAARPKAPSQIASQHWVATWAASPQPRARQDRRVRPQRRSRLRRRLPRNLHRLTSFNNQTVRMIVHTSIGGSRVRVELSNAYGTARSDDRRGAHRLA